MEQVIGFLVRDTDFLVEPRALQPVQFEASALSFRQRELCHGGVVIFPQRQIRGGRDSYFGSTMLTVDLPVLSVLLRDACDAGTARRLAALLEADAEVTRRIEELTARETARVAGATPKEVRTHVTIRSQGAKVFVDVDVEAGF